MASKVVDAFKIKPFDLEPTFSSWKDAPRFLGKPKKDPPVEEWLKAIKAGCKERNIPKEYWHKVAQHYMGDHALARLNELKLVMAKVHGGKYRWNWHKFEIAMKNMGWTIDVKKTETVKVETKRSGFWWTGNKNETVEPVPEPKPLKRSQTMQLGTLTRKFTIGKEKELPPPPPPPAPSLFFWNNRAGSVDDTKRPAVHQKAASDSHTQVVNRNRDDNSGVITAQAPVWLVNACTALDFLQTEHPKVMSTLAAILITVGSIPSIPAVAAGAGGAVLASSAAHAVGAIAVGFGTLIKTHQEAVAASGSGSNSR